MTGISVRGLTVRRGGRLVLEDVSARFPAGRVSAVLGPAGSGKTALLAAVAGLLPAERGTVFSDGRDVGAAGGARRGIGFLAPGSALAGSKSVGDALRQVAGRSGRALVPEVMAALGVSALAERTVGALSHGEGLLALSAARILGGGEAPALLVDEAGAGLGPEAVQRLLELVRVRASGGGAMVLATRDASVAMAADHLVLLDGGRVLQSGEPDQVYNEPCGEAAALATGGASIVGGTVRELRPGGFLWANGARFAQAIEAGSLRPSLGTVFRLCLRPERLVLLPAAGDPVQDNEVAATVAGVRRAGSAWDVTLESGLGPLLVRCLVRPGVSAGQAIRVGWASDAGALLDVGTMTDGATPPIQ